MTIVLFVFFYFRRRALVRRDATQRQEMEAVNRDVSELAQQLISGQAMAVPVERFAQFVEELTANEHRKMSDVFAALRQITVQQEKDAELTTAAATEDINRTKNRFLNVLPYDQTRVRLRSNGSPGSDFINASFISGYRRAQEFIACQGPLPNTLDDFWLMLWQEKVTNIVMLTTTAVKGRPKCEPYWPDGVGNSCLFGDYHVVLVSETLRGTHVERRLRVTSHKETRHLTQLQRVSFDDCAPTTAQLQEWFDLLTDFRALLESGDAPTVVHCGAGVGLTGTFICLEVLTRQVDAGASSISVTDVILALRRQRMLMVQSEKQFAFIHQFLVSYLRDRWLQINLSDPTLKIG